MSDRLSEALADRYRIECELGQGGMATVYLARDLKHDREVAIKVLKPDLSQTLGAERFLREIQLAAKLSHPHILPLFDSGNAERALYYVMPRVAGISLRDGWTTRSSCRWMKQCASRGKSRARSTTRIGMAWCIATSSPRTSCCRTATRW